MAAFMLSLTGKTILILDDDPNVRLLVRKILEVDGAFVFDAENVEEAISLIHSQSPHIILADLKMPGKSGFDFLEHRMTVDEIRKTPTIVMSSLSDEASIRKALSIGITDYIIKPIHATTLLRKIRKALRLTVFLSKKFQSETYLKAKFSVPAELFEINEVGFRLESPVKLAAEENVEVNSKFFESDFRSKGVLTRTTKNSGTFIEGGRYISEVNFVGTDQEFSRSLRAILKGLE
jgi:DNA-binding response OmpR family regulator